MDDLFEKEEYLRCDDCGQYFPKSYLKRCKVCGRVVCGHCRPFHFEKYDKAKPQVRQREPRRREVNYSEVFFDAVDSVADFVSAAFRRILDLNPFDQYSLRNVVSIFLVAAVLVGVCVYYDSVIYDEPSVGGFEEDLWYTIPDEPHIVPNELYSGDVSKTLYFTWRGSQYAVDAVESMSVYLGSKDDVSHVYEGDDEKYYQRKTLEPQQDSFYEDVLEDLREIRYSQNLDSDEYAELIVTFVQSIPYDEFADNEARYPITVFFDGTGDCDEKSMLLCGLLAKEGYGVALFDLPRVQHMSAAIKSNDLQGYIDGYIFVESTDHALIGEVPIFDGVHPDEYPEYYQIGGGGSLLYLKYSEANEIICLRDAAEAYIDRTDYATDEYTVNRHNRAVEVYNELINLYAGDREKAYSLVMQNQDIMYW